jgi:transcriptional regulator with XRE-family HTH domain
MRITQLLESIGSNVRARRRKLDLTQEQLAEAAGVDLRFLQRIERGSTNLSVAILLGVANALAVAPAVLFRPAKLPPVQRGRPPQAASRRKR